MKLSQTFKTITLCTICLAYAALLLARPAVGAAALRDGLILCAERLIPSLLPFLVLAGFVLRSGMAAAIGKTLSPLTNRVFRLPGVCAPVILMALIGGYPVGLSLTASLVHSNQLSPADARQMTRFCFAAGPAFVVLGIGQSLLNSPKAGWIIFTALAVSALIIGLIIPQKTQDKTHYHNPEQDKINHRIVLLSTALTDSVKSAVQQMLLICIWTLLFSTLCAYLQLFVHSDYVLTAGQAMLEVTAGTQALTSLSSLPLITAALAWGGLCVHVQLLDSLKQCGQKLWRFMLWRLVHAVLAALLCHALLIVFPVVLPDLSVSVSAIPSARLWQFSAPAAMGLAAMSVGLLLTISRNQRVYKN